MNAVHSTLSQTLENPVKKAAVVRDGFQLIEDEVARKRGLRGYALKAGYKVVKRVKPDIIHRALDGLLPRFAPVIDPFLDKARVDGDVEGYFDRNRSDIAEAMLSVTDGRAKKAKNPVLVRAYLGLRHQAKGHVEEAVPGLARLILKHVA